MMKTLANKIGGLMVKKEEREAWMVYESHPSEPKIRLKKGLNKIKKVLKRSR